MTEAATQIEGRAILKQSRIAGIWYLAQAIAGPIGIMIVPSALVVRGNATETAARIAASPSLWRLGILAYLVSQLVFIPLALSFQRLFESVDRRWTRLLTALVTAAVPLAILNLVGFLVPPLVSGGGFLGAFDQAQRDAIAMLSIELMRQGQILVGFFWGLWLLPLGILAWKSGWFPKAFSVLLFIGCLGYLTDGTVAILFPSLRPAFAPAIGLTGALGEIPFLLWLLVRGARVPDRK